MTLYKMLPVALVTVLVAAPAFAGGTASSGASSSPSDSSGGDTRCVGNDCTQPSASPQTTEPSARSNGQDVQAPRSPDRSGAETQAPRGNQPSDTPETQAPRGNTGQQPGGTMEKNGDLNDTARGGTGSMR